MSCFEAGDWVVLGDPGKGWRSSETGCIVQIKAVGVFYAGSQGENTYDILLDSNSNPKLIGKQCAGEAKSGRGYNGCSSELMRLATPQEILQQKINLLDLQLQIPNSKVSVIAKMRKEIGL